MEIKIDRDQYDKYVEIYNEQGTLAAKDYVLNVCNVGYDQFQRKMRRDTDYLFYKSTKRYEQSAETEQFMSLEELCNTKRSRTIAKETPDNCNAKFNDLILELMRDRLIELQKFIHFDQASKQIFIDRNLAKDSGYVVTVT